MFPGDHDLRRAIVELEACLPAPLRPLARVAYDFRWTWTADGAAMFESIDPARWARTGHNPRRLLTETHPSMLERAAADAGFVDWVARVATELASDRARPWREGAISVEHPVAFCCSEFGVHGSLPIYSGGLGVLAGDILKEASDLALPMVGVGLMYRTGYFHQRIDVTGFQHEYWLDADPERLPCVKVTGANGSPVTVSVPIDDEDVTAQIWRVDIGRVPLYLLDTELPENSQVGRWVTSRLYESNRSIRLAQYAVLGVGGVLALQALGIEPCVYHLNEGHPALGVFPLRAQLQAASGGDMADAWQRVREKVVFTTHTPVPAGNETYQRAEVLSMLGRIATRFGDREQFLAMGRMDPGDPGQAVSMTVLALRASGHANAVSERHGRVARAMWQPLFPGRAVQDVPISHVTNGVHVPTWLHGPMRAVARPPSGAGLDATRRPGVYVGAGARHPGGRVMGRPMCGTRATGGHDHAASHQRPPASRRPAGLRVGAQQWL